MTCPKSVPFKSDKSIQELVISYCMLALSQKNDILKFSLLHALIQAMYLTNIHMKTVWRWCTAEVMWMAVLYNGRKMVVVAVVIFIPSPSSLFNGCFCRWTWISHFPLGPPPLFHRRTSVIISHKYPQQFVKYLTFTKWLFYSVSRYAFRQQAAFSSSQCY